MEQLDAKIDNLENIILNNSSKKNNTLKINNNISDIKSKIDSVREEIMQKYNVNTSNGIMSAENVGIGPMSIMPPTKNIVGIDKSEDKKSNK